MSLNPLVVYTCIAGAYDDIREPAQTEAGIDYVCLTDQPARPNSAWQFRALPGTVRRGARANRFAKMHPHLLFPQHEASIYVDGSIRIIGGLVPLATTALALSDIALYQHPFRNCVYEEAAECAVIGHDWAWRISKQMNLYRRRGFPGKAGLFECGVVVRRHASSGVQHLMRAWWQAYSRGVRRDQLSLPYLSWALGVPIQSMGETDHRFAQQHFSLEPHRRPLGLATRARGFINRSLLLRSSTP